MSRFFWFTVEFGLVREDGRTKVYGSGLISSHADAAKAHRQARHFILRQHQIGAGLLQPRR